MVSQFLNHLFITDSQPLLLLHGSYDFWMVGLSIVIAIMTSIMAMQLAGMAQTADGLVNRQLALLSGAVVLGAGVWSMHFIGMLAFDLCSTASYNPWITALSMLPSFLSAWVALALLARRTFTKWQVCVSGIMVGAGIGVMHYAGMLAASESLDLRFEPMTFALSVVVAVVLSIMALWVRFGLASRSRLTAGQCTVIAGVVLGAAISGMHYTGMAAARFVVNGEPGTDETSNLLLTLGITAATVLATLVAGGMNAFVRYRSMYRRLEENEEALRHSEQQYRSLIANLPGVAFRCQIDTDWTMLFISDAVERMTGWPARDFMSQKKAFASVIHRDDTQRITEIIEQALADGQPYMIEYRVIRRDGTERWVSESGSGVYDDNNGNPIWIDGIIVDNTEVKLRNAEFEGIANAISRSLAEIEFDLQGHILTANQNFLSLSGYRMDELLGRHHSVLCDPEEVNSDTYRNLWQTLREGRFTSGEFRRIGKNGQEFWIQGSYNPVFDPDGNPYKVIKFASDLTERHAMEQDLREAKLKAEQAAMAKGTFLANMSHEIRTPMNAIIGFTDVLLSEPMEDKHRRHLNTVRNSARSLLTLLNDILDTAKMERGALELESADFSLRELCHQVVASLRISAQKKLLELKLEYAEEVPEFFKGDSMRLQQVLLNLLGNAIKFTEKGGVTLSVDIEEEEVHLVVSDTGIGIPEDRLQRIFDPFSQADASMTRRFGGTGLGTTIARQLVELMHGRILVESTLGVGSRFHVYVPLPAGEAVVSAGAGISITLPPLQILVVDDVPQNVELLELALGREGHHVTTARDGLEAVDCFTRDRFDLILMDVQMPRLDGLGATRRIRLLEAEQQRTRTPIIALTASVLEADQVGAKEAGMDGFATKPVELNRLYLEMARLIGLEVTPPPSDDAAISTLTYAIHGSVIDWSKGLQLWGSEARHKQAIATFLSEHANADKTLRSCATTNRAGLSEAAHRIRGAAGNLALSRVAGVAARIEEAARNEVGSDVSSLLVALGDELASVVEALGNVVELPVAEVTTTVSLHEARALLDEVDTGLARGELMDEWVVRLEGYLQKGHSRRFSNALEGFDFDAAREVLKEAREVLEAETRHDDQ